MDKPFQRKGSVSNTHVGNDFEAKAQAFFTGQGLALSRRFSIEIGVSGTKPHNFDLGDHNAKVLVECKAHTWTEGGNVPSAKMTTWNQAMYYFHAAPSDFRKIMFVLKDYSKRRNETLAEYYIRTNPHLIPAGVEIWEYDDGQGTARKIKG